MIFAWDNEEERLLRFMRIPAKKKLEWLNQMNELADKVLTSKQKAMRLRLRQRGS